MEQPEETVPREEDLAAEPGPPMVAAPSRGCEYDTTCLAMALGLGGSVAAFVGIVVFFYFYNAQTEDHTRTCGEVMAWGVGYLKAKFESCVGSGTCSGSRCEAEEAVTCTSPIPWFESRCQCCDWCLLRTLACLNTDHDRGSFQYCRKICRHL
ncbi:uncharacterized protein LOC142563916 [Dermacentor variabilis]|uniref:uncharacterized protein LOC142563916 n=1 Tax=Dermacentor variabilis TaxID=34621 RepID=UPI003F5C4A12